MIDPHRAREYLSDDLHTLPPELLQVFATNHRTLANLCAGLATRIDECAPGEVDRLMRHARARLRYIARHHFDGYDAELPECRVITRMARQHLRLCIADIVRSPPAEIADWSAVHHYTAEAITMRVS